jgi:hypothetical protein
LVVLDYREGAEFRAVFVGSITEPITEHNFALALSASLLGRRQTLALLARPHRRRVARLAWAAVVLRNLLASAVL